MKVLQWQQKKSKNLVGNDEKKRKSTTKLMGKKCKTANQDDKLQQEVQSQRVNAILAKRSLPLGQMAKEASIVIRDEEEENIPPSFNPQCNQSPSWQSVHGNPGNAQQTKQYSPHSSHSNSVHSPALISPRTNSIPPSVTVLPSTTAKHSLSSVHRSLTPLRATSIPINNHIQPPQSQRPSASYMSMLEDDSLSYDILSLTPSTSQEINTGHVHGSDWDSESFASHFTEEFESLKAEVDTLRTEVKSLKKAVRDIKANRASDQSENNEEGTLGTLLKMVENTSSSFHGLKIILFHLFNEEELRTSSLKGLTTIAGGTNPGIDKEKLNLLYAVMEKRYQSTQENVDKWIRGQQRKLREQFKRSSKVM